MFTVSLNWSSPAFCSPGLASGSTTTGRELGTGTDGGVCSAGCALVELRVARVLGDGGVGALGAGVASDRARGLRGVRAGFGGSVVIVLLERWVSGLVVDRHYVLPLGRYPGCPYL